MPKRKKISLASEDSKDGSECSKQRKFLDPLEICHELYETIRNHKADDGRLICESFIRTPNRRSLADYYDIVTSPIDLMKIQQKLKTDDYVDVNHFTADVELMVNNAKLYYKRSSQEYKDACEIWDIFVETKNELLSSDQRMKDDDKSSEIDDDHGSECSEDDSSYEELFTTVMTAADMEGRPLSTMFQLLPSRSTSDLATTSEVHIRNQEKTNRACNFKILIPSVAVGAIIGKKGKTVEQLQKEAGATVRMSKATEFYPGTTERVCLITGTVESILTVLQFIMEKVHEKLDSDYNVKETINYDLIHPAGRGKQVKVLVPNGTASMIIGHGGTYIKEIINKSGSYVQISQQYKFHALAERCITVIGEMKNNKTACHMILVKIVEDPMSSSCLNISYADVIGPIANSNPTGSPLANCANVPTVGMNNSTGYNHIDSLNSSSPTITNNFYIPQSTKVPFIGVNMVVSTALPTNAVQMIETTKAVLRSNGYSMQAVSEISAAINTLANYGMIGLGEFNEINGAPVINSLEMEMSTSGAASYLMSHEGISNQDLYRSTFNVVPEMEAVSNSLTISGPVEARSSYMYSPIGILENRMSEMGLGPEFTSSTSHYHNNFLAQVETPLYEPFLRTSPALASPNEAALPVNNNSFGLGTSLISDLHNTRKPLSSDQ